MADFPFQVTLPDGRTLQYRVYAPEQRDVLLFHHGTPGAALAYRPMADAAARRGLRTVVYAWPGYGESSPNPGRSVADAATDSAAVLDALCAQTFRTIGWSGGGPHALACSALLADRCRAAVSPAGVASYVPDELDWLLGMGPENVEEFTRSLEGADSLRSFLEAFAAGIHGLRPEDIAASLGGLLSEIDQAHATAGFAEYLLESFRLGFSHGIAGERDDDLAFVKDWGFDLRDCGPVAVWQGDQDRMVPFSHGVWLADHIPGARAHMLAGHGHLSISIGLFEQILDELLTM